MGQAQASCGPAGARCAAKNDRRYEADGDNEVQSITDDPYMLSTVVKASWSKIPPKRPEVKEELQIPVTFQDMFKFNVGIMCKPGGPDMRFVEVLLPYEVFGQLVSDVDDPRRLKNCCEAVVKKITERGATIEGLDLFKAIMLASLRALLPKEWSKEHELAWAWFWEKIMKYVRLPSMNTTLVQISWSKIDKQPRKLEGTAPDSVLAMVPTTFKDMANFNNMVLAQSNPERPDMSWAPDLLYPALDNLVSAFGNQVTMCRECDDLAERLKANGVSAEQVEEFKTLLMCSLRSLMPSEWDEKLEVAWSSFWDSVARLIAPIL